VDPSEHQEDRLQGWQIDLAYDGSAYHGWQIQPNVVTVQGELQHRLRRLFGDPELTTAGTSRTDAGVHALDQKVSFTSAASSAFTAEDLTRVLNRWLPPDIRVCSACPRPPGFHVRRSVCGKAYAYALAPGAAVNPFLHRYAWRTVGALDRGAMESAARSLVGHHDFRTFCSRGGAADEDPVKEVFSIRLLPRDELLFVEITGRSFLYKMVRTIVGYLVSVGCGRLSPEETPALLEARDRTRLPAETAPAQGLFLTRTFLSEQEREQHTPILPHFSLRPTDPTDPTIERRC
jgi:tRNA pseudouridine38-40 synthase